MDDPASGVMPRDETPGRLPAWLTYCAAVILSLGTLVWMMGLWQADLRIPFDYARGGDALFYHMLVKTIADHGWFLTNPNLGAPADLHLHDWLLSDNFPLFLIKLLALFTADSGLILNLYFLLTFPLTTVASLWALRVLKLSDPLAIAGSLLYTFLPAHFLRGESHLLLATYFQVPLLIAVALWISRGEPLRPAGKVSWRWLRSKAFAAALISVVAASCNVYYAFFAAFLFCVAGAVAWFRDGGRHLLIAPVVLSGILLATLLVNLTPSFVYAHRHGKTDVTQRSPGDTEIYGLKLAQLVLPIGGHRLAPLRKARYRYDTSIPALLNNENAASSLGAAGSVGFLVLLATLFGARLPARDPRWLHHLSLLNLAAFLLATIGGLSSLFAVFVLPQIRAHNRISVFIAFFSLAALAVFLDGACGRIEAASRRRLATWAVALVATLLGLFDQVPPGVARPPHARNETQYHADAALARELESFLPEGAMIFQLPYVPFPHTPSVHRMFVYDHFRVHLHSEDLRWSFGAMAGRDADGWQRRVSSEPLGALVQAVAEKGFAGIYVDRFAYPDDGAALLEELTALTSTPAVVSDDERRVFFALGDGSGRPD